MPSSDSAAWLSDDAPSRRDLVLAVVVTTAIAFPLLLAETIFWGWLVAGFLVFTLAVGPLAASSIGTQVGAWFRSIGYAGRGLVIGTVAVLIWTGLATLSIPGGGGVQSRRWRNTGRPRGRDPRDRRPVTEIGIACLSYGYWHRNRHRHNRSGGSDDAG
ncbi:hypothetical protein [Halomontanus rarus]|uniref:hypothetical protein n=1 Tax=Halomontanus rarus TaxID=3034020 RepID=UPI0023E8F474|nr:hypothetical protein [Halovivax sp. TS33]